MFQKNGFQDFWGNNYPTHNPGVLKSKDQAQLVFYTESTFFNYFFFLHVNKTD